MSFDPQPGQALILEKTTYQIAEHPAAPGISYGQEGRAAIVYKLETARQSHALKVFKPRFRLPTLASLADQLAPFASLPGLTVCRRVVLTPQRHGTLLRENPDLTYSVLMPWIEGPTWLQIVQERQEITQEQSLFLARSFAGILADLEQQGIAHCDLSAANLILPALADKGQLESYAPIELVDVEQLYASELKRPASVPSGSEGYAHSSIRQGVWEDKADRFAGAVLLAEMLGWSDHVIRKAAWGESYFAPQEMQRPCTRFDMLHQSLAKHWGNGVAQLFANAWNSELLADCPTFGEWMVAIPEATLPEGNPKEQDVVVSPQVSHAEQIVAQNNVAEPVESHSSSDIDTAETVTMQETQSKEKPVETTIGESSTEALPDNSTPDEVPGSDAISCPFCQKIISVDTKVCPYCETTLSNHENEADIFPKVKEEDPTVTAKEPERTSENIVQVCQKCNYAIPNGMLICHNCGHSIAEPVSVNGDKSSLNTGEDVKGSLIWLFVFLGGILLLIYIGVRSGQTPAPDPSHITQAVVSESQATHVVTVPTKIPTITPAPTETQTPEPDLSLNKVWENTATLRDGEILHPSMLATDSSGNIYLTDATNYIHVFSMDGHFIRRFGGWGFDDEQFKQIEGITIGTDGFIYVVDKAYSHGSANGKINIFSPIGNFVRSFGNFDSPSGIAASANGTLFLVEQGKNRILNISKDGVILNEWGSYGSGDGQFNFHIGLPSGIAVDRSGNIFVADNSNHRIQKFSADGSFISSFSSGWPDATKMSYPIGITVSSSDLVYVVDGGNHRIQIYDADGNYAFQFGGHNNDLSGFGSRNWVGPYGVASGPNGEVVVADYENDRIKIFNITGKLLSSFGTTAYNAESDVRDVGGIKVLNNNSVAISDGGHHSLKILSENGTLISRWELDPYAYPSGLDSDSENYLYVFDTNNRFIHKFSPQGKLIKTWGESSSPGDNDDAPDGTFNARCWGPLDLLIDQEKVFVADTCDGRVQVFDLNGKFMTKWSSEGFEPGQLSYPSIIEKAEDDSILIIDNESKRVSRYTQDGTFINANDNITPEGSSLVAIDSTGLLAMYNQSKNQILVMDKEGSVVGTTPANCQLMVPAVAFGKDGSLYVSCSTTIAKYSLPVGTIIRSEEELSLIAPDETAVVYTDPLLDKLPELAFFSYRDGNDNIYLVNSNGTGLLRITNGSDFHKSPVWSPDGTKIAYSDISDLWIMNADGSVKHKLTFDGVEKYPSSFTPDGKYLIYEKKSSSPGIYSLNLENRQTVMVSNVGSSPTVSPDGMKIAYWKSDGYYVMNLDGSDNKLISRDVTNIRAKSIAWSPDGTILACVSKNNDIMLYGLDGSEIANLTNGEGINISPSFSPDGKFLSFTSDRFDNNEIFVLNLSNNVLTRLTHNAQNDEGAVWRPTVISSNNDNSQTKPVSTETPVVSTDPLLFLGQTGARFVDPIGGAKLELIDGSTKLRFSVPNYRRDLNPATNLQAPRLIIKSSQGMETKVQTRFQSNGFQAAGLLSWISQGNFVWFGPSSAGLCGGTFINSRSAGNAECLYLNTDTVGLRIDRDGNTFNLSYSIQDGIWLPFDTISYTSVPEQISSGLFLINQWEDVPYSADFYYFKNLP